MNATQGNSVRIGMEVITSEGDVMGRVSEIGSATFEIARGLFLRRVFSAPATAIARVEQHRVMLSMSRAELEATRARGHIGTTLAERADGVVEHVRDIVEEAAQSVGSARLGR
jgi:hypothetical protein